MLFDYKVHILAVILCFSTKVVTADTIHDPTAPKFAGQIDEAGVFNRITTTVEETLSVQGIVNKKDTRMAIIGGQLVRIGEQVNGYTVKEVNRNNVVLTKSGSEKRLYVYE